MPLSLSKKVRLHSIKNIEELFSTGSALTFRPLRCIFIETKEARNSELLVAVPKRLFRRAVDRNRLKRRIREAYRLNQGLLAERRFRFALTYINNQLATYAQIEAAVVALLSELSAKK